MAGKKSVPMRPKSPMLQHNMPAAKATAMIGGSDKNELRSLRNKALVGLLCGTVVREVCDSASFF
jgi:hypothetical protein